MINQIEEWAKGNSIHTDQCCPDFSCCNDKMKTPVEVRQRFLKAHNEGDEKTKMEMLGMFLGEAMATYEPKKKVYIAGLDTEGHGQ